MLEKDLGDGAGFVPAAGETVTVTLTATNGASIANVTSNCSGVTDAAGQCTVTFTSPTPGKVTGHASSTGTLGTPAPFTVTTDGVAPNSGPRGQDVRRREHPDHAQRRPTGSASRTRSRRTSTSTPARAPAS